MEPLSHIRVLDLTRARSGPTCVRQLSEMGAQVIKVEMPGEDDDSVGGRHGSDFQNLHPNKRSITVDMKTDAGREIIFRLARRLDVLVENFRPRVKHRLGIDYETLKKINPRLVYTSISGFGQDGPYAEHAGLDQIAQGLSGFMTVNGFPEHGPLRAGLPIADLTAGFMAAYGIVVALLERERSGEGQWVHTSLLQGDDAADGPPGGALAPGRRGPAPGRQLPPRRRRRPASTSAATAASSSRRPAGGCTPACWR